MNPNTLTEDDFKIINDNVLPIFNGWKKPKIDMAIEYIRATACIYADISKP